MIGIIDVRLRRNTTQSRTTLAANDVDIFVGSVQNVIDSLPTRPTIQRRLARIAIRWNIARSATKRIILTAIDLKINNYFKRLLICWYRPELKEREHLLLRLLDDLFYQKSP